MSSRQSASLKGRDTGERSRTGRSPPRWSASRATRQNCAGKPPVRFGDAGGSRASRRHRIGVPVAVLRGHRRFEGQWARLLPETSRGAAGSRRQSVPISDGGAPHGAADGAQRQTRNTARRQRRGVSSANAERLGPASAQTRVVPATQATDQRKKRRIWRKIGWCGVGSRASVHPGSALAKARQGPMKEGSRKTRPDEHHVTHAFGTTGSREHPHHSGGRSGMRTTGDVVLDR